MLFLALRHLFSRKKQTILIFLGISLGTMMYTVISGMQEGMKEFVEERLMSNTSHIKISAREQTIKVKEMTELFFPDAGNYTDIEKKEKTFVRWLVPPYGQREEAHIIYPQGWFDRLRENNDVIDYAPTLSLNVIITKGKSRYASSITGIIPERHERVMSIEKYIQTGNLKDLQGGGSKVIAGKQLLENIGARLGDTILLSVGTGELKPLKIVGIIDFGVKHLDARTLLAHLTDVQKLNKTPGQISEISVSLYQMEKSQIIADQWKKIATDNVESWQEANANFLQIFRFQDIVRDVVTIAMLIVAGFGIYNVLSITINQKKKEIAILRSMGFTPRHIIELFLIQGVILGITGALVGLLAGFSTNLYMATIELGSEGNKIMISHSIIIYITAFLLAFISAVLASILPSFSAGKLTPIDIIRSEV